MFLSKEDLGAPPHLSVGKIQVLGVGSIHNIVEAIDSCIANYGKKKKRGEDCRYFSHEDKNTVKLGGDRVLTTPEYAAYLKISEGCDNRCTYCAIPDIRGKFRSRPMDELVEEARELDAMGIKELTVIAQDTTRYGIDLYGEYCLDKLLHRITEETNIPWIRVLYCYPDKITDGLIEEMKNNPRILNYIDLPLQHISDNVLRRMNRHGRSAEICEVLEKLRREIPDVTIRTTFIVGFPGETEEDFTKLCEFVKEQKFARVGVFTYSREEGTPAYDFADQIDEQVKQDRMDILMRSQIDISEQYLNSKIGKAISVICEDYDTVSDCYFGRSEGDAPEIDGKVFFESERKIEPGEIIKVKIRRVLDYDMYGFAMKNN